MRPYCEQNDCFGCIFVRFQAIGQQSHCVVQFKFVHKNPRQIALFFFAQAGIICNSLHGLIHHFFVFCVQFFGRACE